jgi:hypothetical protein
MQRVDKDVYTRLTEVLNAWEDLRSHKQFFGLTLEYLMAPSKPFVDAGNESTDFDAAASHAVSKKGRRRRRARRVPLGDGYVAKRKRASGLVRRSKHPPPTPGTTS